MTKVLEVSATATDRESFVSEMAEKGVSVSWTEKRKYITFTDDATGIKVRDKKLSQTFNTEISKEALQNAFIRNQRMQAKRPALTGRSDRGRSVLENEVRSNPAGKEKPTNPASGSGIIGGTAKLIERISSEITRAGGELEKRLRHLVRTERTAQSYAYRYGIECESDPLEVWDIPYDILEKADRLETIYSQLIMEEEFRLECLDNAHIKDWFREQAQRHEIDFCQSLGEYIRELQTIPFEDLQLVSRARSIVRKNDHPRSILKEEDREDPDLMAQAVINVEKKVQKARTEYAELKQKHQIPDYTPMHRRRGR